MLNIKKSTAYPLIIGVTDENGDFVTGSTISYEIRKSSDNSLITSGSLTSTGNIYTDSISINDNGDYYALYTSPSGYENGKELIRVDSASLTDLDNDLTTIIDKLCKVLGLSQSNYILENPTYDSTGCLLTGRIKIYNNATDADNEVNELAQYDIEATWVDGLLNKYKVTEI